MSFRDARRVRRAGAVTIASLALLAAALFESIGPTRGQAASQGVMWGARVGTQLTGTMPPWDMAAQARFERLVGKRASLMHWGAPWQTCHGRCRFIDFDTFAARNVTQHGSLSVYDWAPYRDPYTLHEPAYALRTVTAGRWDAWIRSFATQVRRWGRPLLLRFAWEMNGNWFPWAEGVNGNRSGDYVRAWRHTHQIFDAVGARNVTWVWCPNVDPRGEYTSLASLYPGDRYVDWICLDGYNWGTNPVGHRTGWQNFDDLYRRSYDQITALAPTKPLMIGELGSTESGGSKAAWIADTFARLHSYPKVRALLWMNDSLDEMDWRLDSSRGALAAFQSGIQDARYATNIFGGVTSSPVLPPR